ncbi:hypothetical protein H2198_003196 [Neophaeococcomyces mojaviensis]|uniref:Uncharacterized protein n=1 Tax=Neophaeococcomyces mojaviensis TaxID=3383035 RepID=A0ACC3ABZ9_9EURO|nr:hypothetical protein H2198_003196 [Knufia sp. JES_112]
MASATGIPEQNAARDEEEPLLGRPGDVTQKPEQGFHWNLVTGTAVVAQAGVWILVALVWSAVFEANFIFFSYHPLLNSAGILVLIQSILLLQPTATQKQKIQGTYIHSGLNFIALGLLLAGLVVIEMNKASHPETRFQSVHGRLGLAVYILLILQFLIGVAQFYLPSLFGSVDRAKAIYKYHRMSGYAIIVLSVATICLATQTGFNKNVLHIRLWATIVAGALLIVGLLPRIKKHKLGM